VSNINNEVVIYESYPQVGIDTNVLSWWKMQKDTLPILSKMARKYLSVPATSVPSESLFSKAGIISSGNRSSISPKVLRELLFLHKNQNYL